MKRTQQSRAAKRLELKRSPSDPTRESAFRQAMADKQAGRLAEAERQFRDIVARHPHYALAFVNLAEVLRQQGQLDQALALCQQGVDLDRSLLEGRLIRGAIQGQRGETAAAIDDIAFVIARNPSIAALHVLLGDMLIKDARLDEALSVLQKATRLDPTNAGAWANLGTALQHLCRDAEACAAYQRAVSLEPRDARTHSNLAGLLSGLGHGEAAIASARRAIALDPQAFGAHFNLAAALNQQGDIAASVSAYRQALALHPDHSEVLDYICHLRQSACDWAGLADDLAALRRDTYAKGKPVRPFTVLTAIGTLEEQLKCARFAARAFRAAPVAPMPRRPKLRKGPLRIGYLSGDFHNHATAMLIAELFELQDKTQFTSLGYSLRPDSLGGSAMRRRLVDALDGFVDLSEMSSDAAARRIHADEIDILIDLKGYTAQARTQILAHRPAPIQVNYLGYPGTMGAPFIDYIIADAFVAPTDHAAFYDEKIVHLPHCYQPNDRRRDVAPVAPTRAECSLPEAAFVFCCFNNSYKITPEIFDIWMRLLGKVAGSVLWLLDTNAAVPANLRGEALLRGIAPDRLVFAQRLPPEQHVARLALADLFLDTLPVNAHTTASEALFAGLPVLTCVGDAFVGRVAGSLLKAIGLPDLITTSLADYEARALALAGDPLEYAALRRKLCLNRSTLPLFDTPRYTRNFESALLRMIEIYDAGLSPQAFVVAEP